MLTVIMSEKVGAFLIRIPFKHAQQIVRKIDLLAQDPNALPTQQLSGYPSLRRMKSGEYRLIYRIKNDVLEIHVLRIGKRNDEEVYRDMEILEKL